jgi:D-3-phosphoglycerate dehydrogenase / 2-oxoglutarate reductase
VRARTGAASSRRTPKGAGAYRLSFCRPLLETTFFTMPDKIAITAATMRDDDNEVCRRLRELGYQFTVHPLMRPPNREEQRSLYADAVGVIAGSEPITRQVLEEAGTLKVVSRNGVGYDAVDLDAATDLGVVVAYVPDAMVDAVADMTIGLLLAVARRIPQFDSLMKQGEWQRHIGDDVTGRTLGLVGTGRIGMAVARRAQAFRMRLLGCDPYPNAAFGEELGGKYVPLDELLETSDFVSLHSPATPETRGIINERALARMKPSAYIINCARGSLIDEAALIRALTEGRLKGAGLDVFSKEPPDPDSPAAELARLPNVVAVPHVSSYTPITAERMGLAALENMLKVLRGERVEHVANPAVYDRPLR